MRAAATSRTPARLSEERSLRIWLGFAQTRRIGSGHVQPIDLSGQQMRATSWSEV
jgi:hypothetical protein